MAVGDVGQRAKKRPLTLLISSAGRRVELLRLFRTSAQELEIPLRILAADAVPAWSPACAVADGAFAVPPCSSADFIPRMLQLCALEGVDLVVPTIDTELLPYAEHSSAFATVGTRVVVPAEAVVRVFRDKQATAEHLSNLDIPAPKTWSRATLPRTGLKFPLFCKPRHGSRSVGARPLKCQDDVLSLKDDDVVQEFIDGQEYTVNVFVAQNGQYVCAVPHLRAGVRDGEVCLAQTAQLPELEYAAQRLAQGFAGLRGVFCFQAIVRGPGDFRVIEVNPRFGGGYPIAHHAGAPMTTWLLAELLGIEAPHAPSWRAGVKMLRYDAAVFLEQKPC